MSITIIHFPIIHNISKNHIVAKDSRLIPSLIAAKTLEIIKDIHHRKTNRNNKVGISIYQKRLVGE